MSKRKYLKKLFLFVLHSIDMLDILHNDTTTTSSQETTINTVQFSWSNLVLRKSTITTSGACRKWTVV